MRTHINNYIHKKTVRICNENNVPMKKSMHLITSPPKKKIYNIKNKRL